MEHWYRVVFPRKEVREGRSFNPDEFAIHLEQVVDGRAPEDYRVPSKFFQRTCFTRALTEHAGMLLRRLAGETANTAPVLTLVTQFGGGKTHTLTALFHLASTGPAAREWSGIDTLLASAGLAAVPEAKVGVFVGNAWDPREGRETPWIDLARQLAGDAGVAVLGPKAQTIPPGTQALADVFRLAEKPVLILCDEVLNFVNRHRDMAEPFHAFLQNLTVAMTGTTHGAAVISLPRSQTEMTDHDIEWQEKITKVVRRVAKDLIVNDEGEIAEVIRRRLFDELDAEKQKVRRRVARAYATWAFEKRAQLPTEWTAVDSVATEGKALEHMQARFEACYPFHPATISVFQRKWQALAQYQQTRGTLAMLAQWLSWVYRDSFQSARREPLITLGSAPLQVSDFRSVVLGQLGEGRLGAAIDADIAGVQAHARTLDAVTDGPLADIHRAVATAIFFESSGGQVDRVAHLPELRFAIGGPELDTTSVDTAALALESKAFFIRRVGSDGFRISYRPTLKKVVNDRRASLDEEGEVKPAVRKLVQEELDRGRTLPLLVSPGDGAEVPDSPRLTLVGCDPEWEWTGTGELRERLAEWTRRRGTADRLYPGALVWCVKKLGRELHDRVQTWLAWRRVRKDIDDGVVGGDFEKSDLADVAAKLREAGDDARDEVWASYRFVVLADPKESDGLRVIDLGAGHAGSGETLCGRVVQALKSGSLLNESVGAGYLDRNWPPALRDSGAWPLMSLRQSFLNGALTRLVDPDAVLRAKITEFVGRGEMGLGSGEMPGGGFDRVWFGELLPLEEVAFERGVFLLTKQKARSLRVEPVVQAEPEFRPLTSAPTPEGPGLAAVPLRNDQGAPATEAQVRITISGTLPLEAWNRFGTRVIPKIRTGTGVSASVQLSCLQVGERAPQLEEELRQLVGDLGLEGELHVRRGSSREDDGY